MPEADRRQARIDAGRCASCGQEPPAAARLSCPACLERGRELAAARHERLVAAGRCIQCGQADAEPGYLYCPACRAYQARAKARASSHQ